MSRFAARRCQKLRKQKVVEVEAGGVGEGDVWDFGVGHNALSEICLFEPSDILLPKLYTPNLLLS